MTLFCDSSFFVAYYSASDQYHPQAVRIINDLKAQKPQIITTDYVFDETLTFLLATHHYYGYPRALKFDENVTSGEQFKLLFVNENLFYRAKEIFKRFNKDKRWSFTDCTSYVLMKDFGIRRVLTFDENFSQMGFKIVK